MFPRVGCRFMHVSTGFVVIVNVLFSESEYWVDVGRREISPRQEHEGEPPTFDDFGHAGEGWPAAGCARRTLTWPCTSGQPQPLL